MEELIEQFRKRMVVSQLGPETVDDYTKLFRGFAIDQNINVPTDVNYDKMVVYIAKATEEGKTGKAKNLNSMLSKFGKLFELKDFKVPPGKSYKRKKEVVPFTKEEVQRMIDFVRDNPTEFKHPLRVMTVLKFIPMVGMRGKDFEKLDRIQFMEGRELTYHTSKKNKDVNILMPKKLVEDLKLYFKAEPQIKDRCEAFNMTRKTLNYYLKKLVNKLGILGKNRNAFPHLLRHSMITMYHDEGVDIKDIAEWVGHSDIKHTESYIKVDREKLKQRVASKTKHLAFV
jgi:integrase